MNKIIIGDCRETMRQLVSDGVKVQMCVTSPPYYGLRDYGHADQLGLEETPEQYIANMVEVFRLVRELLADDGVLWLNIGDSYAGSTGQTGGEGISKNYGASKGKTKPTKIPGCKPKDLIGIPWMLAFALRADGWYLRQDIIWHKPNPMPESVTDRCTKAHEYIFLLSKKQNYYYDHEAIKEPAITGTDLGLLRGKAQSNDAGVSAHAPSIKKRQLAGVDSTTAGDGFRNKRSVWTVNTKPYKGFKVAADYVGGDGKSYTASADCPIHGHLSRKKKSCTLEYGGQPDSLLNGSAGSDDGLVPLPACGGQAMTGHKSVEVLQSNAQMHTTENTGESKTGFHQTECISDAQSQTCTEYMPASGAQQDCGEDYSRLCSSSIATLHNTETSKTGHVLETIPACTPCAETEHCTPRTPEQRGLSAQGHGNYANNTLMGGSPGHPLQDTAGHSDCTPSALVSSLPNQCSCKDASITHFAVFPEALIEPCILAGSRVGDVVLDPFGGSGTTAQVAQNLGRQYILCELNPEYGALQHKRTAQQAFSL